MGLIIAALAVASSVFYGASDVLAATVVRRYTASSVALVVQATGLVSTLVGTLVTRPQMSWVPMSWGLFAGALGAAGVLAFYTALQNGPASAVAPVASTGVLIPVLGGLLLGESLTPHAVAGIVLLVVGVMGIAFCQRSAPPDEVRISAVGTPGRTQGGAVHDGCKRFEFDHPAQAAVILAGVSAVCFGSIYLALAEATAAAPSIGEGNSRIGQTFMVALAVQVGALAVTGAAASRHTAACVKPNLMLASIAVVIGLLDVTADFLLTYAISVGPVAVIGPLGSLDPVVAVIAAAIFLGERMDAKRIAGIVICMAGIVLVAI